MNRIVLYRPVISEKSMKLTNLGLYTFEVVKNATKPQIAKAVADKFKVDVLFVKTINTKGEKKMQKKFKGYYQTKGIKKAIVKLKKGQKIATFEAAPEKEEGVVTTAEGEPQVLKERKDILRRTKVKVEKGGVQKDIGSTLTTQRKVITGK